MGIIKKDREVWLVGEVSAEPWYNSGDSVPFDPIDNRFAEVGTIARYSIARYSDGILYLGADERGAGRLIQISGEGMSVISSPQIETMIGKLPVISDAEGWTYYQDGHEFYMLTFPLARLTLCYDFTTQSWHKRETEDEGGRHIASTHEYWAAHNMHVIGDYASANIYEWKTDVYQDNTKPLKRSRTGQSVHSASIPGPPSGHRVALLYHWVEIDCVRGRTDPNASILHDEVARVRLEWSDDGGLTYGSSRVSEINLGKVGENFKIKFFGLGRSYDRRFRVSSETNQDFAIVDAFANVSRCVW